MKPPLQICKKCDHLVSRMRANEELLCPHTHVRVSRTSDGRLRLHYLEGGPTKTLTLATDDLRLT